MLVEGLKGRLDDAVDAFGTVVSSNPLIVGGRLAAESETVNTFRSFPAQIGKGITDLTSIFTPVVPLITGTFNAANDAVSAIDAQVPSINEFTDTITPAAFVNEVGGGIASGLVRTGIIAGLGIVAIIVARKVL